MKNNRTFLEKLLDGAEVEWKPLWSITTWDKRFNAVEKEKQPKVIKYHYYLASELKPLIVDGGNVKLLTTNESDIWTTEELVQNNISEGEIIAIPWGGNPIVQYYKGKFVTADNRIATSNNTKILDNKFLYYFLLSKLDVISSFYRGSGIKHPSMYHVLEMLIPIPSLSVQTEIVRILDALTALTSELTSELTLRRKQYEYYREKLLSFDSLERLNEGGGKKKLIDVAIYTKVRISADKLNKENYVGVENLLQNKLGKTSSNYVPTEGSFIEYLPNDILIGNIRPYLRKIWLADKTGGTNGDVLVIRLTDKNILPRYLYHILANEHFFEYNVKYSKGAKMPRGDKAAILQYEFDVPPLEEQHRIVSILDKFETLTNSITEGLPLAIEQSQKRYEYYRELLLNFE
ncbi:MAG: restriction endonuclease subunit S [Haemophilus parainfluenzae]|jgi:putative type I restriction-modification system, specificity determinant; restriction endonuclease|uniref:restriction endonuclease subunit S n=1 Tax=uncultured Haemophilus sp. TaxID=237779 RepID=UPI00266E9F11|nr:restriction endonuclease subunit S [uncultured Haemophilus sp.]MBS5557392.1 restriction endonuclease subunit S [Haemophilus parainfluenzae]MBS6682775.1 restriction endonuclease subunit S [Haemophilus parainfluenzae]MDU4439193.1 restriction endonuclease subunit S [Haemophilus parainfluenzae]MDU4452165.1 restriction endonuclease subunit S [Haemophilus parainfluenzae]MDU4496584.1 restriction endonuclease subunit S [Haemophilus parainfluenzae]